MISNAKTGRSKGEMTRSIYPKRYCLCPFFSFQPYDPFAEPEWGLSQAVRKDGGRRRRGAPQDRQVPRTTPGPGRLAAATGLGTTPLPALRAADGEPIPPRRASKRIVRGRRL